MNLFRQMIKSFTNFSSYREFAFQNRKQTFKYFLLVFTLVFIISNIPVIYKLNYSVNRVLSSAEAKLPEFILKDGELHVEGKQPIILDGGNSSGAVVIDTTGKTNQSVLDKYRDGIFVSKSELVIKDTDIIRSIRFGQYKDVMMDKPKLIKLLPLLKWILPFFILLGYMTSMVWAIITVIILAVMGMLVNSSNRLNLKFNNIWNIAVYAFTLPWLLEMMKKLIFPSMSSFWALKWGLAVFILYKALEAIKKIKPR